MRFVVTADNHLSAYSQRLTPSRLLERRARLRAAFARTVTAAMERQADAFVQAGDLFDNLEPLNADRAFVAEQFKRLHDASISVFAISGNHDTSRLSQAQGGTSPLQVYQESGLLQYLADQSVLRPRLVEAHGERIAICGLSSQPTAVPGTDPLDGVVLDDPDAVLARASASLLILHAQIEGFGYPSPEERIVRRSSIAALTGFNVVVAGHIHDFRQTTVGTKAVILCGATERMDFGSLGDQTGCVCIDVSPSGSATVEHIAIPAQPRCVLTIKTRDLFPEKVGHAAAEESTDVDGDAAVDGGPADGGPADGGPADGQAPGARGSGQGQESAPPTVQQQNDDGDKPVDEGPAIAVQEKLLARVRTVCAPDVMVRLEIEGPLTRDQHREFDLRAVWLFGQQHAFSFELDESGLTLATMDSQQTVVSRGQRVSPRDTLLAVIGEKATGASDDDRALFARIQAEMLAAYDGTGAEGAAV